MNGVVKLGKSGGLLISDMYTFKQPETPPMIEVTTTTAAEAVDTKLMAVPVKLLHD